MQAIGIVFLIGIAERIGIPVISAIKSLLKINGLKEITADNRNGMQTLLSQMEILSTHFNHTTTEHNERIISIGEKTLDKLDGIQNCIKNANNKLDNFEKYGIKPLSK